MSYFENNIYIQTAYQGVRNKSILNVNTSSDFCVFVSPSFTMSGASKLLACSDTSTCTIATQNYNDILTGATDSCFTQQSLSATCLELVHWKTKISENDVVVYSADFHTSTAMTGNLPTDIQFTGSVITAFNTLGYDYTVSGTTYTITKPYGITDLKLDICIEFDLSDDCVYESGLCSCPSGYSLTPANDSCVFSATTAATFNGLGSTIVAGDTDGDYSIFGTYFFTNETYNQSLPLTRIGASSTLEDQSGGTISPTIIVNTGSFWTSGGLIANGRLNNAGISASTTEYLGFSQCIDIMTGGTYYIGIAADNRCEFKIDGEPFLVLSGNTDRNHKIWHVFPYDFSSGKHIIEMEGLNLGSSTAFAAEIYNPVDFDTLTGSTTTGTTGLLFSSADRVGTYFDLGTTIGYSCPSGYSLDLCGSPICTELLYTGLTPCYSAFTGTCTSTCTNVCTDSFSTLTTANTSVHIITTATTQEIIFDFTGNTDSFTDTNTTFKYDIYKFDNNLGYFHYPPVYRSNEIAWSTFSGTSALTQTIPLSNLSIDGDYLIKGFFVHDVCTEFANRLGYRNDTASFITGNMLGLYESNKDFYMAIFREADTPTFTRNSSLGTQIRSLRQRVIIPKGNETEFILPEDVNGDFIVTLNGLSLSKDYDYSVSQYSGGTNPYVISMSGSILNTDIISVIYSSNNGGSLKTDVIDITTIPSGPTDGQGNNNVYYNSTTNKYEIYLSVTPLSSNDILIMINGVTLANGVDYYQSISNSKRIIFTGTLLVGDIITTAYVPNANFVDSINTPTPNITWSILNAPQLINGKFILEFASDITMTTQVSSAQTEYIIGQNTYSTSGLISGSVGTQLYYRVTNIKNYETLCGDMIESIAYSEIIPITIATNSINSY